MNVTPTRQSERRHRQRAANRSAILDAARRVMARGPEEDLSLRAVAAEAGYAPASVYEYFRNRADLILALATEDLGRLTRNLRELDGRVRVPDAAEGRLEAAARVALDSIAHNAALAAAVGTLQAAEIPAEAERQFNGKLIGALTTLADVAGRSPLRSREEQIEVVLIAAALVGVAMLEHSGRLQALGYSRAELLHQLDRRYLKKHVE